MSDDRRRNARVQGGFNRSRGQRAPQSRQDARNPQEYRCGPRNLNHSFVFEETNVVLPEKPPDKIIDTEGSYEISLSPSGSSKIIFYPNFLEKEMGDDIFEELYKSIDWQKTFVKIQGETYPSPRLVKWFGPLSYGYSGVAMESCNEWHPTVTVVQNAVQDLLKQEFNSVLLNLYRDEHDSVAWHSDDELSMGICPTIASVSLGESRKFELRKKPTLEHDYDFVQHYKMTLPHGSLVVMDGCTQQDWQHRVPKEYHNRKPRINLTFRTVIDAK